MTLPILLAPQADAATLKERRWGGPRLAQWRSAGLEGRDPPNEPIGESWEFSTLDGSASMTEGRPLAEVLGHPLPFLAKLIDTAMPLSVQVHPADDPKTGESGKEEAWVILDADPGATILVGIKDGVDADTLATRTQTAVADPDQGDALLACLEEIPVGAGDVILVPARTPHAIGGGILLAEIQQPADCTYRYFDYGSGRPIHVEQALNTTNLAARPVRWSPRDGGPEQLRGQHVALDVLREGSYELVGALHERLLIPALGECTVRAEGLGPQSLNPGDLRLHTRGPLTIEVGPEAVMVVGWLEQSR